MMGILLEFAWQPRFQINGFQQLESQNKIQQGLINIPSNNYQLFPVEFVFLSQ